MIMVFSFYSSLAASVVFTVETAATSGEDDTQTHPELFLYILFKSIKVEIKKQPLTLSTRRGRGFLLSGDPGEVKRRYGLFFRVRLRPSYGALPYRRVRYDSASTCSLSISPPGTGSAPGTCTQTSSIKQLITCVLLIKSIPRHSDRSVSSFLSWTSSRPCYLTSCLSEHTDWPTPP